MECLAPIYIAKNDIMAPCGRCAFCGATKRSDWALRLHYEQKLHYGSKFVTLTYANNELTWSKNVPQLNKRDVQLYLKRLRKAGHKFRYFLVGEYGSQTFRPHYHIILFGDVPDKAIEKAWGKGHCHIGKVTSASIMYCLGYIVNGKGWKMKHHRTPPFTTMSRGRGKIKGLGFNYLTPAMIAWHKSERKNYAIIDGEKRHLPRYYKEKLFSKIDRVRIAVRDARASEERLRKKLFELSRTITVSKAYPRGALSYHEQQMRIAAKRIRDKTRKNLTI